MQDWRFVSFRLLHTPTRLLSDGPTDRGMSFTGDKGAISRIPLGNPAEAASQWRQTGDHPWQLMIVVRCKVLCFILYASGKTTPWRRL
jgi:hypothetical protein